MSRSSGLLIAVCRPTSQRARPSRLTLENIDASAYDSEDVSALLCDLVRSFRSVERVSIKSRPAAPKGWLGGRCPTGELSCPSAPISLEACRIGRVVSCDPNKDHHLQLSWSRVGFRSLGFISAPHQMVRSRTPKLPGVRDRGRNGLGRAATPALSVAQRSSAGAAGPTLCAAFSAAC